MIFDYVLVLILSLLAGAWSIPAGIQFGLAPFGVFLAATLGSLGFMAVFLVFGGRLMKTKFLSGLHQSVADSRAGSVIDRWGLPGLAVFGALLLGPSITLAAAVIIGVERKRFAIWYAIVTTAVYGVLTTAWTFVL